MTKPTRCIDPVMKYCQECPHGVIESNDDTNEFFETHCMYGFEKDEPTEEELKELDDWLKEKQDD